MLRTSVAAGDLDSPAIVSSYKALAQAERAFRAFDIDLDIRPIRHRTETQVRTHVFLRMLSYYISWHMQARLAPVLFADDDKPAAQATRPSPVAPATRSPRALAKAATKQTPADLPVHSFGSLLADLATICLNTIAPADPALPGFRLVTTPTRCSGTPSTCSASATASASRSQAATSHHPKTPGKRPSAPIAGGNFGLTSKPDRPVLGLAGRRLRIWVIRSRAAPAGGFLVPVQMTRRARRRSSSGVWISTSRPAASSSATASSLMTAGAALASTAERTAAVVDSDSAAGAWTVPGPRAAASAAARVSRVPEPPSLLTRGVPGHLRGAHASATTGPGMAGSDDDGETIVADDPAAQPDGLP